MDIIERSPRLYHTNGFYIWKTQTYTDAQRSRKNILKVLLLSQFKTGKYACVKREQLHQGSRSL